MSRTLIVPGRLGGDRFRDKLLAQINGVSLLRRCLDAAVASNCFDRILFASEDIELFNECPSGVTPIVSVYSPSPLAKSVESYVAHVSSRVGGVFILFPDEIDVDVASLQSFVTNSLSTPTEVSVAASSIDGVHDLRSMNVIKLITTSKDQVIWGCRFLRPMYQENLDSTVHRQIGLFYFPDTKIEQIREGLRDPVWQLENVELVSLLASGVFVKAQIFEGIFRGIKLRTDLPDFRALDFPPRLGDDLP